MSYKFDEYINSLKTSNLHAEKLIDFTKINFNYSKNKHKFEKLNNLICKTESEIKQRIFDLFNIDKDTFSYLPFLFGLKNKSEILIKDKKYIMKDILESPNLIFLFLKEIGAIENIINNNIYDFKLYYYGVLVGMDSNSRKNRNGKVQEEELEKMLKNFVETNKFLILEKQKKNDFKNEDLNNKVFDFIITNLNNNKKIFIESSFYNSGGSKISETARSYFDINKKIMEYENYKFIWVADGEGMRTIKKIIKEYVEYDYITNTNNLITLLNTILKK